MSTTQSSGAAETVLVDHTTNPNCAIADEGPLELGVGHALISLTGPEPGYEVEYNRWYEDDHYHAGGMYSPWMYAGRRWLATPDLRALRLPGTPCPPLTSVDTGWVLGTYWIAPGRIDDVEAWAFGANRRLAAAGRIYPHRTPGLTAFQDLGGVVYRDDDVVRAEWALHDPAAGLVLEILDTAADQRDDLLTWLLEEHLPQRVTGPVTSAMVFEYDARVHAGMKPKIRQALEDQAGRGGRLTILWFLDEDPRQCWDHFVDEPAALDSGGIGRVSLVAPFVPAKMGTNHLIDELAPAEETR